MDLGVEGKPKENTENEIYVASFYMPDEIIINILRKLTVESLLRFRCVSKQWLSLISQITTRLQKVLIANEQTSGGEDSHLRLRSVDQNTLVEDIDMVKPGHHNAHICGSCNGLLLIECGYDLFLWNPSTRCCIRHLPLGYGYYRERIGLCFDSDNDEYKVVGHLGDDGNFSVASFKTNSWKSVYFPYRYGSVQSGPVLNNNPHWFGEFLPNPVICYFDSKRDVIIDLLGPSCDVDAYAHAGRGLGVLDGCLCMSRTIDTTEVFVMKEYGVRESWTILFKFELWCEAYYSCTPLFFTNEKKCAVLMLLRSNREDKIVSFDIDKNVCKELEVGNSRNRSSIFQANMWEFLVYEEAVIRHKDEEDKTAAHDRPKHVWNLQKR